MLVLIITKTRSVLLEFIPRPQVVGQKDKVPSGESISSPHRQQNLPPTRITTQFTMCL